eukprot:PhF_6_TR24776/c0_g1_i3/m.34028
MARICILCWIKLLSQGLIFSTLIKDNPELPLPMVETIASYLFTRSGCIVVHGVSPACNPAHLRFGETRDRMYHVPVIHMAARGGHTSILMYLNAINPDFLQVRCALTAMT